MDGGQGGAGGRGGAGYNGGAGGWQPQPKVMNKCTHIPLIHIIEDKANAHIERMNGDGWELISVAPQAIGQFETFVLFWRKVTL